MSIQGLKNVLPTDTKITLTSPAGSSSKKSILKADNETPWTAQSLPSSVHLIFQTPIPDATHIALTFQGGFVGTKVQVYVATRTGSKDNEVDLGLSMGGTIYPEDKNKRQVFEIPFPPNTNIPSQKTQNAIDSQPVRPMSPSNADGPTITTIVPPNPSGGGEKADLIVPEQDEPLTSGESAWTKPRVKEIKLEFEASSDQFGRITLYQLELLG